MSQFEGAQHIFFKMISALLPLRFYCWISTKTWVTQESYFIILLSVAESVNK